MDTYPRYPDLCGWNALLPTRAATAALEGIEKASVVIVGAGYTGLAAARRWATLRPDDSVVVLDAATVGEGSPGRNSGFMLEIALADDADAQAVARMNAMNALCRDTMGELAALVVDHQIPCDLTHRGTYRAAATARGLASLAAYEAFLKAAQLPYERLSGADLTARLGTAYYQGGLYSPDCYLVQPAALIRGLAEALPPSVQLFENSPVLALKKGAGGWSLHTPEGEARAPTVLLANNGYAARLAGGALGRGVGAVTPVFTFAGLTAPLTPDARSLLGSDPSWGLLPAHRLGTTLRLTEDHRLLVRSFYDDRLPPSPQAFQAGLQDALDRRFPALAAEGATHITHHWGGATGITYNGTTFFGGVEHGLYAAAGCNGGGVVKGSLFGRLLVDEALGSLTVDVKGLFGAPPWLPPNPLRHWGFSFLTRRWRREAGAEL
ncbi:MAG: FAD-dependent oxidoreductase [Pseudomonadota bacterium]|nr:FAD-dependent oxidoreductase [Pseudomonadota bacterium]